MLRLTFATRIGMIVVLSLTTAWIGSIALFYLSQTRGHGDTRPLPAQIAALADALERTAPEQRSLILRAVNTVTFVARLERGASTGTTPHQLIPQATARATKPYLDAIGGRLMSVAFSGSREPRPGSRISFITPVDLEFRIALRTHDTLVIEARSNPVTNALGLPIGFVAGTFGALLGLVALLLLHREIKPLTRLSAAVDQIDLAGSIVRLPDARSSAPEIRALIEAFNRLQSRLHELLRARMAMLGGISHDVRTFATRLRLRVDHIPAGTARDRAVADIDDMILLLDDALLASRAGAGELAEELVDLDELVRAEVEDRRAEGRSVDLQASVTHADMNVLGDRVALRRIVANLIDNALKYGHTAHVSLKVDERAVLLRIDDEGPGIATEQRGALLEPFVRLEGSRNRRTGGAGLGLAIVRNLVEAHEGSVAISEASTGGARVCVTLPLFRPLPEPTATSTGAMS